MILEYINGSGGSVSFASPDDTHDTPYWLTGVEGFHGIEAENVGIQRVTGDGMNYIATVVKPRLIRLTGLIGSMHTAEHRITLLETIIPNDAGRLIVMRGEFKRSIECYVQLAPSFEKGRGDQYTIELWCADPYWADATGDQVASFDVVNDLFHFPLESPMPEEDGGLGFIFGEFAVIDSITVMNSGQADTGLVWDALIIDPVGMIRLIRVETQEKMQVNSALNAGDRLSVSTRAGQKYVRITRAGGIVENGMQYISPDFTFFQMRRGANTLKVEIDTLGGGQNSLITYRVRYTGV
ncbi:tail protein [Clostridia bacterium]|nr:tail protein [Clostridia bacterium]